MLFENKVVRVPGATITITHRNQPSERVIKEATELVAIYLAEQERKRLMGLVQEVKAVA